jgi:uncharacterized protein (DUF58 family)
VKALFRVLYRFHRLYAPLRRWVARRFTPAGLTVLAGVVLAGVFGPDTDNNVAYQGFTILFALVLLAVCLSWFFRARFSAVRVLPQFGTAGVPFHYMVVVENLTRRAQKGLTLLEDVAEPHPAFEEWLAAQLEAQRRMRPLRLSHGVRRDLFKVANTNESPVPLLPPGQPVEVAMEVTPLRRGVLRFAGVLVARPDPLGLFRATVRLPLPHHVLILPKRYPVPPMALPGTMKYQEGGVALAANVGQSEEFVALRDYRHGDPLRHIHWRSWAKTGKPVVKEFADEFFVRHALVLDTFTTHRRGEAFEEAVSVAASFACTIQTQESLLDLLFVGPHSYCFTAGRGLAQTDQLLEVLASVRPCHEQPFQALEHLVLEHLDVVSGCVCVLLAWDAERQGFVEKLRALGVPVMVLVVTEPGTSKALEPGPMADEPNRFMVLEVGTVEQGLAGLKG